MSRWLIALLLLVPLSAGAAETACGLTPKLTTVNYPGAKDIPTTNNLLAPTGKSIEATGQRVIIIGRVLDKNCMPVPNATVEIWQVDPFGKWILATDEDIANPYPTFAGAGRTYTDGTGNFFFITAFPSETKQRVTDKNGKSYSVVYAPNINLRVDAQPLPAFSTRLYFMGDTRNAADPILKKLSSDGRNRVMLNIRAVSGEQGDGQYATIDIVLPGTVPYLRY